MLCLILERAGRRRIVPLRERRVVIGRAETCDVVVDRPTLSGRHAALTLSASGLRVEDLGSTNGTFVNGRRISDEHVDPPVELRFGSDVRALVAELDSEDVTLDPTVRPAEHPAPDGEAEGGGAGTSPRAPTSPTVPTGPTRPTGPTSPTAPGDPTASSPLGDIALEALADGAGLAELLDALVLAGLASHALTVELHGDEPEAIVHHAAGEPDLPSVAWDDVARRLDAGECHGRLPTATGATLAWANASDARVRRVVACLDSRGSALSSRTLRAAVRLARPDTTPDPACDEPSRSPRPRFELRVPGSEVLPGAAPALRTLHDRMSGALTSGMPVLLTGETGVGKEIYARALHAGTARGAGPFVAVNVPALPESLLESLVFGAEAGAATGVTAQRGLVREADGGTLFLDEIGEMSLDLQAKLLRVLELREVLPLGATKPVAVDVRFVAATNREIDAEVEAGRFRRDLYYRLSGHVFRIPSLRERRGDVPRLVEFFLRRECERLGRPVGGVTLKAMQRLVAHDWPGNIRELEGLVRRLANEIESGEPIRATDLPAGLGAGEVRPTGDTLDERIDAFQAPLVRDALEACDWNRTAAAERLGVSRPRLRALIRRLDLEEP